MLSLSGAWRAVLPDGKRTTGGIMSLGKSRVFRVSAFAFEYPSGTGLRAHRDNNEDGYNSTFCLNVGFALRKPLRGGTFHCKGALFRLGRVCVFDGARCPHGVTHVQEGTRVSVILQFSLGHYSSG